MKIRLCFGTAILSIAILLASCGNNAKVIHTPSGTVKLEDTGGLKLPLDDKNTELTFLVSTDLTDDLSEKYVGQKLQEITGIRLKFMQLTNSTVKNKLKVLLASRDIPDIIGTGFTDTAEINDLGMQGAFAPVDEHLDIMPNFRRIFYENEENRWIFSSYQAENGHLYFIPNYDIGRDVNHGILYRKDIFDKHQIALWNSPDSFYSAMKQLKEIYPKSTPFVSKNGINLINQLSVSWGIVGFSPYYDEENHIWKYSDTDDKMKEILDYLKKLYSEGLIDPEFLTTTQAAWSSKMTQHDKAFVTFDWINRLNTFTQIANDGGDAEYDLRYGPPIGPNQTVVTIGKAGGSTTVAAGKNAELAFQLSDFLLSDAGAALVTMGLEGETYQIGENGKAFYSEFGTDKVSITELENKYGMFVNGMYKRFDRRSAYYNFTEREQEAQNYAISNNKFEPMDPVLSFNAKETEEKGKILPNLKKAAEEFFMQYILTDNTGDASWEQWKQKAESLGASRLIDIYNQAQERYLQKNK